MRPFMGFALLHTIHHFGSYQLQIGDCGYYDVEGFQSLLKKQPNFDKSVVKSAMFMAKSWLKEQEQDMYARYHGYCEEDNEDGFWDPYCGSSEDDGSEDDGNGDGSSDM
jgi:hypothetical protein